MTGDASSQPPDNPLINDTTDDGEKVNSTIKEQSVAGDITWRDGDVPFSPHFDDVYYNSTDGLAETRYVFLDGNNLPAAWGGIENFTIGETGFGTGLNFLAAWQCWAQDPNRSTRLHFVSVEKYPLSRDDMIRAHQSWPELSTFSKQLTDIWPTETMLPGIHRFVLGDGAISLTVLIGDAITCFGDYDGNIDCWFLDGFAPSRNADMWHADLFSALASASNTSGATLATFTSARIARDGLEGAGFTVTKRKGFGHKRDMITATLPATQPNDAGLKPIDTPWFVLPQSANARPNAQTTRRNIAVIGGGMAGAACAQALKQRGCDVHLFEKAPQIAGAASGNAIGMLEPYLTADNAIMGRFYEAGFRYSNRMIKRLHTADLVEAAFCGVLDMATTKREQERHAGLLERLPRKPDLVKALDRDDASTAFGMPLPAGGLFYPNAGWVNPPSFVKALSDGVNLHLSTEITDISDDASGKVLSDHNGVAHGPFDAVIIASATDSTKLSQTAWLRDYLQPVRGQISTFPESVLKQTNDTDQIRCVLSHKGYLTPARKGIHVLGATFSRDDTNTDLRDEDHAFNIAQLATVLPDLASRLSPGDLDGRAAIRPITIDHLPMIGPAPDYDAFLAAYPDLDKGKNYARYLNAPYHKDVYICTGFGARGLIAAPLAAEILASEICAMPLPLEKPLMHAVHPARFIIRGLKRRQIAV